MNAIFVETRWFTRHLWEYFATDKDYSAFQAYLMENPRAGDVVQGCGGIRKARWGDPRRGKHTTRTKPMISRRPGETPGHI